jgi:hypothetical protein
MIKKTKNLYNVSYIDYISVSSKNRITQLTHSIVNSKYKTSVVLQYWAVD